jgi:hypothetical protein
LEDFLVLDLSEIEQPRLLSERNVLSFVETPSDHVIQTYLSAWDPMLFAWCYYGSTSQFGKNIGGMVGHGERIYIKSAAFLYGIGPALKGTPKDDPKVVAAIRAAKGADEVAKYLESESAQYRYEALRRFVKPEAGNLKPDVVAKLESLAKTDQYEEIRAEALRILGLETDQPGAKWLMERIAAFDLGNLISPNPITDQDLLRTMSVLGKAADPALTALVNGTNTKNRVGAALLVEQCGPGGDALRDALLAFMDESKDEGALRLANNAARALVTWPADEKVRAAFASTVNARNNQKGCFVQTQGFEYLTKHVAEDKRSSLLGEFAAQTLDNSIRSRAVEQLVDRKAFDVLGKVIQAATGPVQGGLLTSLCQVAKTPEEKKFAVEQMKKKLEAKANPEELGLNALPALGADAGPLLPLLKALPDNAMVKAAIVDIEARVAAEEGKK